MEIYKTNLPEVLIIDPKVFGDDRGFFYESFQAERYEKNGMPLAFVQDNVSRSFQGTLRGLHYQKRHPQGKLVYVISGEVFDVAVDIRKNSPTFGRWTSIILNDENHKQLYVPPGFAHGFCVLSKTADFIYKCTDYYDPSSELTIKWDDPELAIDWPIKSPLLSKKDAEGVFLKDISTGLFL